jgi:hypothetical protein
MPNFCKKFTKFAIFADSFDRYRLFKHQNAALIKLAIVHSGTIKKHSILHSLVCTKRPSFVFHF